MEIEPNISDNKKKLLQALEDHHGIISAACRQASCSRDTYYRWYKEDAEFARLADEAQEIALDFVESKLFQKINGVLVTSDDEDNPVYEKEPSDTAIIFYLKTKGKKRGYVERQELVGDKDAPIVVIHPSI